MTTTTNTTTTAPTHPSIILLHNFFQNFSHTFLLIENHDFLDFHLFYNGFLGFLHQNQSVKKSVQFTLSMILRQNIAISKRALRCLWFTPIGDAVTQMNTQMYQDTFILDAAKYSS